MSGGQTDAGARVEVVPVIVAARNEERSIGPCLRSLLEAADVASRSLPLRLSLVVGADRCSDRTVEIAESLGVPVVLASGGKVAAQRACLREAPFSIFSDADVEISPETLRGLCRVMLQEPHAQVAYPRKQPRPPRRSSLLAQAAHSYTRGEGFQRKRTWFDGKCFAIRRFEVPTREQISARLEPLGLDRFYAFHEGLTIDDVFLSRWIVHHHGVDALRQSEEGVLWFRAPETASGMYSYYRRIRRELERVDRMFPEMIPTGQRFGYRRTDWARFLSAPLREQLLFAVFQAIDHSFGVAYAAERSYYQRLALHDCDAWPVIPETKG